MVKINTFLVALVSATLDGPVVQTMVLLVVQAAVPGIVNTLELLLLATAPHVPVRITGVVTLVPPVQKMISIVVKM